MPPEAVPWIIAVMLFFGSFLVTLASVALWCALPGRKPVTRSERAVRPAMH